MRVFNGKNVSEIFDKIYTVDREGVSLELQPSGKWETLSYVPVIVTL